MKTRLLLILMFFVGTIAFGQNITFKYKNVRSEIINAERPSLAVFSKFKDSITIADPGNTSYLEEQGDSSNVAQTNFYEKLAVKFKERALEKQSAIDELYSFERQKLIKRLDEAGLDERELKKIKVEFDELDMQMKVDKKIVKDLMNIYLEMRYKARNFNKFKKFPVRNSVDAQLYYDYYAKDKKSQFLKNSVISFSPDGGKASLYNELFADYFGPIRFGIGALVSNKETKIIDSLGVQTIDSTSIQKDAVQRLLGGGGNVVFNVSYPLLGYSNAEETLAMKLIVAPKLSFDVPKLGTENKDYSLNYDLGIEGSIFYTGVLDVVTFYGNFRIGMISGNDLFYQYLNKDNDPFFSIRHQLVLL